MSLLLPGWHLLPAGRFFPALPMRYPFLHKIDDAPGVSVWHRKHLRRAAETICKRTGLHACYNDRNRSVLFHFGDQFGGPLRLDAYHPDGNERKWSDSELDDAVELIRRGYIPREQKDRIEARNKWLEECDKKNALVKHTDDRAPEAKSVVGFKDRQRRGVQKVISA